METVHDARDHDPAAHALKPSLEGWKLQSPWGLCGPIMSLETFLRGMETYEFHEGGLEMKRLETFLRGMETTTKRTPPRAPKFP